MTTKEREPELFPETRKKSAERKPNADFSTKPLKEQRKKKTKKEPSRAVAVRTEGGGTGAVPSTVNAPKSMLQVIAEAVSNPACDVGKMKALLDMQERIEANDARKAFTVAFNALQAELPVITKDGKIDHGDAMGQTRTGKKAMKARFATYPNIMSVVGPLLKKNGFTLSNVVEPSPDGSRIIIVGYLEHIAGHSRTSRFPLGIDDTGKKNNQQGWGSSQQYGMRYNAIALLNIVSAAPEDADNDGETPESVLSPAEVEELKAVIADANVTEENFCKRYKIEEVAKLPTRYFDEAKKALAEHKKKQEAK